MHDIIGLLISKMHMHMYEDEKNCQTSVGRENKEMLHLKRVIIDKPFNQWGLDVIVEIIPDSYNKY